MLYIWLYLAYLLACNMAIILPLSPAYLLVRYVDGLAIYPTFYLAYLLASYPAYLPGLYPAQLLAFYLAYLLASYLTCYLEFDLTYLQAFYLEVEVQRCSLSFENHG
jgi:hypothetical protein